VAFTYNVKKIINNFVAKGIRSSSVTQYLALPTLNQHRDSAKLIFMYKILHQVVDVSVPDSYLTPNTRGHPSRFIQLQTNVVAYKHSFYSLTIRLWNALPIHVIEASSVDDFQNYLSN